MIKILFIDYTIDYIFWEILFAYGLIIAIALFLMLLTDQTFESFLLYLTIFICFGIYCGLIEFWNLVILFIIDVSILYYNLKSKKGV